MWGTMDIRKLQESLKHDSSPWKTYALGKKKAHKESYDMKQKVVSTLWVR